MYYECFEGIKRDSKEREGEIKERVFLKQDLKGKEKRKKEKRSSFC